jgi:hypothetical protein
MKSKRNETAFVGFRAAPAKSPIFLAEICTWYNPLTFLQRRPRLGLTPSASGCGTRGTRRHGFRLSLS